MKKLIFISLLGALSLGATAYAASDSDTVTISGAESRIEVPANYKPMWAADYDDYLGAYYLSNGKTLTLAKRNAKVYAAVDNAPLHELVASAANTFVAKDAKLKMTINLHADGDASGVLYMVVPGENMAQGGSGEHVVKMSFR